MTGAALRICSAAESTAADRAVRQRGLLRSAGRAPGLGPLVHPRGASQERPRAALVTQALWHETLGELPLGGTFVLDGAPYTLVGLVNPAVQAVQTAQVFLPFEPALASETAARISSTPWEG